jgi:hypothetical protein
MGLVPLGCGGGGPLAVGDAATRDGGGAADLGPADLAAGDAPEDARRRPPEDVDILFVIDDSARMAEHQANLGQKLPVLIAALKNVPGGLPSLHIGVVTGDLGAGPTATGSCRPGGDRGVLRAGASCGLDGGARFLSSAENGTSNNFAGDVVEAFACLARVGSAGCTFQQPLEAARLALSESVTPENAGFLRAGAQLLIVFVTNQDDCSAPAGADLFTDGAFPATTAGLRCAQAGHLCAGKAPPLAPFTAPLGQCTAAEGGRLVAISDLAQSIRALKRQPERQILVSAIVGWPADAQSATYRYGMAPGAAELDYLPICAGPSGAGVAALRVLQFVRAFGASGILTSICEDRFGLAVSLVGQRF